MYPQHWEASTAKEKYPWYIIILVSIRLIYYKQSKPRKSTRKIYIIFTFSLDLLIMYVHVYVCVWMSMCMCECTRVQTFANVHAIPLMWWTEYNIWGLVLSFYLWSKGLISFPHQACKQALLPVKLYLLYCIVFISDAFLIMNSILQKHRT